MFTAIAANEPGHSAGKDLNGDRSSPTILYLHIPKAAGTTLSVILEERLKETGRVLNLRDTRKAVEELTGLPQAQRDQLQLVRGHFPYGIHECLRQPYEYITILRDPVERLISHYYYVLRKPIHYLYPRVTSEKMGLKEYALGRLSRELDNGQVRQISGNFYRDPRGQCSRDLLDQAKENLRDRFAVVGLAERFDETVLLLSQKFGWKDLFYVRQNVTRDRPRREQLPADVLEAIKAASSLDLELYAFATELFERAVQQQDRSSFELKLAKYRKGNDAYGRQHRNSLQAQGAL
jgi:hypothetical protein